MTFQKRLQVVMEGGNLRIADLARLFCRRHSTVRGWVVDGREPAGTAYDVRLLFTTLVRIEVEVKARKSRRARRTEIVEALCR